MIEGLYPYFLDMGYEPSLFYDLTLAEINDLFESYERKQKRRREQRKAELKDMAMLLYNHATQIADSIAGILPGASEHERIPLASFYPELFEDEAKAEAEKKKQDELALHKARMQDFVYRHNEAMRKRGESNGWHDTRKAASDHSGPNQGIHGGNEESAAADREHHEKGGELHGQD